MIIRTIFGGIAVMLAWWAVFTIFLSGFLYSFSSHPAWEVYVQNLHTILNIFLITSLAAFVGGLCMGIFSSRK